MLLSQAKPLIDEIATWEKTQQILTLELVKWTPIEFFQQMVQRVFVLIATK